MNGAGARGVVLPGVFQPLSDTWQLAEAACAHPLRPGGHVLELCAGPALAGVAAARRHRAHLTTVDVSRRAVLNARLNALLNGVRARTLRGDLFDPVGAETFDLILANAPYVPGPPPSGNPWDGGPDGRAVLDRICAAAPAHLAPGGALLLVHSEFCDVDATLACYARAGLAPEIVGRRRGPLGPTVQRRRGELVARGLLFPDQTDEDVLVLRGVAV